MAETSAQIIQQNHSMTEQQEYPDNMKFPHYPRHSYPTAQIHSFIMPTHIRTLVLLASCIIYRRSISHIVDHSTFISDDKWYILWLISSQTSTECLKFLNKNNIHYSHIPFKYSRIQNTSQRVFEPKYYIKTILHKFYRQSRNFQIWSLSK